MTMRAKDIRQFAWQSLSGKWGICIIIFLIYDIILGACGGLSTIGVGAVLALIIAGPLELGYTKVSYQVVKGEKPEIMTFLTASRTLQDRSFCISPTTCLYLLGRFFLSYRALSSRTLIQ